MNWMIAYDNPKHSSQVPYMEFDGDIIHFNLSETIKHPIEDHSCFAIDIVDSLAQVHLDQMNEDALEVALVHSIGTRNKCEGVLATHGMETSNNKRFSPEEFFQAEDGIRDC